MSHDITIFDRQVLRRRRARAARGFADHNFLMRHAAEEAIDRLHVINRSFPVALDLGCHSGIFARLATEARIKKKLGG